MTKSSLNKKSELYLRKNKVAIKKSIFGLPAKISSAIREQEEYFRVVQVGVDVKKDIFFFN